MSEIVVCPKYLSVGMSRDRSLSGYGVPNI